MKDNNRFDPKFEDSFGNSINPEADVFNFNVFNAQTSADAFYEAYKDCEVSYKAYEAAVLVRSDFTEVVAAILSGYTYCKVGSQRPYRIDFGDAVLMDSIIDEGRSLIMADPSSEEIRKFKSKVLKVEKDFRRFKKAERLYEEASEKAERLNECFDNAMNDANDMINRGDYKGFINVMNRVIPDHNVKLILKAEAARAMAREREIFEAAKAEKKKNDDRKTIIQEAIKEGSMYLLGAAIPLIIRGIKRK